MPTAKVKTMKWHNFSAGPAILPPSVIREAATAIRDFNGSGLSILELSHRGPLLTAMFEETESLLRELTGANEDYGVLFLTGGASSQFFMVPMNLLDDGETAAYVNTGIWADKAIKEARSFGHIVEAGSSKDQLYQFIPKKLNLPANTKYLHITSNNTIYGSQYHRWPKVPVPLVCDMSSDFLSRPFDIRPFGLIYAGAQKNLGPAGTTVVIVRKDLLGKVSRKIPTMLDYLTHIKEHSLFNTPPVYAIYVCLLTMRWIKAKGGLAAIERINKRKARVLYSEIDSNPLFRGTVKKEDRSLMNVCFVMENPELEPAFLKYAKDNGVMDIKGHRTTGGFRASIYNAMPIASVKFLTELMRDFAQKNG